MKYIEFELSEKDIIIILNSLSYFRNEVMQHPDLKQKERVGMYFNFIEHDEFTEQYNSLDLLHKRISTQSNHEIYNIKNDIFFKGQEKYLNNKKFDFLYNDNRLEYRKLYKNKINIKKLPSKNNKYFFGKFIDKLKEIV